MIMVVKKRLLLNKKRTWFLITQKIKMIKTIGYFGYCDHSKDKLVKTLTQTRNEQKIYA